MEIQHEQSNAATENASCFKKRKCLIIGIISSLLAIGLIVFLVLWFQKVKASAFILKNSYVSPSNDSLRIKETSDPFTSKTMKIYGGSEDMRSQLEKVDLEAKSDAEKYQFSSHGFEIVKNIPNDVLDEAIRFKHHAQTRFHDNQLAKSVRDFLYEHDYVDSKQKLTCSPVILRRESQALSSSSQGVAVVHYDFFEDHQDDEVSRNVFAWDMSEKVHSTINVWLPLNDEKIKNNMLAFIPQDQFSDAVPFVSGVLAASVKKKSLRNAKFVYDKNFHWGHGWVFRTSSDSNEPLPMHASIVLKGNKSFVRKSIEIRCALHD